jgi:hypothetical protein
MAPTPPAKVRTPTTSWHCGTVAAAAQPPAPSPTACSTVRAAPSSWPTSAVFCARAAATPAAPG